MTVKIITNYHWHDVVYGSELTGKHLKEWQDLEGLANKQFVIYQDYAYILDDFSRIDFVKGDDPNPCVWKNPPVEFKGWHGYLSDSYFSGVLIRLSEDGEQYQTATYFTE